MSECKWCERLMREVETLRAAIAAAEERGRRRGVEEERKRAMTVVHVLHQCIRGKCACASEENGGISQFACEDTARKTIDAWTDIAPRDSAPESVCARCGEVEDSSEHGDGLYGTDSAHEFEPRDSGKESFFADDRPSEIPDGTHPLGDRK